MGNPNKTLRTALRWTHVLVGWPIGVFVYVSMARLSFAAPCASAEEG